MSSIFGEPCPDNKIRGGIILDDSTLGLGEGLVDFFTGNFDTNWISGECVCGNDVIIPVPISLIKNAMKKGMSSIITKSGGRNFLSSLFSRLRGVSPISAGILGREIRFKTIRKYEELISKLKKEKSIAYNKIKGVIAEWEAKIAQIDNVLKEKFSQRKARLSDLANAESKVKNGRSFLKKIEDRGCKDIGNAVYPSEEILPGEIFFDSGNIGRFARRVANGESPRIPPMPKNLINSFLNCVDLLVGFYKSGAQEAQSLIPNLKQLIGFLDKEIASNQAAKNALKDQRKWAELTEDFVTKSKILDEVEREFIILKNSTDARADQSALRLIDFLEQTGYGASSFLMDLITYILEALNIVQRKKCTGSIIGLPDGLFGATLNEKTCECSSCPEGKLLCDLSSWVKHLPTTPGSRMSDELSVCIECCDDANPKARWFTGGLIGSVLQEFGIPPCTCECPTTKKQSESESGGYTTEWKDCDSENSCPRKDGSKTCRSKNPPDNLYGLRGSSFNSRYSWNEEECRWDCKIPCYETRPEGAGDSGECCFEGQVCSGPPDYECCEEGQLSSEGKCCPEGLIPSGGKCCPEGFTTSEGKCCPDERVCGTSTDSKCCSEGEKCVDGKCCQPCSPIPFPEGPYTACCKEDEDCLSIRNENDEVVGTECCKKDRSCGTCCDEPGDCSGPPWWVCCPSPRVLCQKDGKVSCCENGEVCSDGQCCPEERAGICGCCPEGHVCIEEEDSPFGNCCPQERVANGRCCPQNQISIENNCCPQERVVNNQCCPEGKVLTNNNCCDAQSCDSITFNNQSIQGVINDNCECEYEISCSLCSECPKNRVIKGYGSNWVNLINNKSCSDFTNKDTGVKYKSSCAECSSSSSSSECPDIEFGGVFNKGTHDENGECYYTISCWDCDDNKKCQELVKRNVKYKTIATYSGDSCEEYAKRNIGKRRDKPLWNKEQDCKSVCEEPQQCVNSEDCNNFDIGFGAGFCAESVPCECCNNKCTAQNEPCASSPPRENTGIFFLKDT
jgi:hypothetical protein